MELITRKTRASEAPTRWKAQYSYIGVRADQKVVTKALARLAHPINPDIVDQIVGNTSWTKVPSCDECGEHPTAVVKIGECPDYGSRTANVCLTCLLTATKMLLKETTC